MKNNNYWYFTIIFKKFQVIFDFEHSRINKKLKYSHKHHRKSIDLFNEKE